MKKLISNKKFISRNSKVMSIFAAGVVMAGAFAGCGAAETSSAVESTAAAEETTTENTTTTESGDSISVVTTIFPEYDWVKEITAGNDNVDITMLLDNGVDLHSYQPTAEDIMKIATCDVFIYVGGESDEWVEDALAEATNENMQVVNLLDTLGESVKEEEVVEGMEGHDHEHEEEGEEHEHDEAEETEEHEHEHEEGEVEYDEHVWLSLKNSQVLVSAISDAIGAVDSANAELYSSNADSYNEKLADLDSKYQEAVDAANVDTVLFGDRFPFRYMVDDYNLNYYAAFVGCSAETEASFETITFLAGKVDELGLNTVLTIENSDEKIAKTIIENTEAKDAQILSMDSMQSTTSDDVASGASYYSIMESNLEVLTQALQ